LNRAAIFASTLIISMIFGILIHKFQPSYYVTIVGLLNLVRPIPIEYTEILPGDLETDVASLISIRTANDVLLKRNELIFFLYGNTNLPSSLPSTVVSGWHDSRYDDLRSMSRVDKIVVAMDFSLESIIYHFVPSHPNGKVILYHEGHNGDFINGWSYINRMLNNGFDVFAFSMPLLGLNNQPYIVVDNAGQMKIATHGHLQYLLPKQGHTIKYFIEPVVVILNYIYKEFKFLSVSMVGISGGGWTTTLAAAVDPRINNSFPVAGSLPIHLRSTSKDWGDYEQNAYELYAKVNYLDLYILGSYGANRMQLQIINQYDPCCFSGRKSETYSDKVISRVSELGSGKFHFFLDSSHRHHIIFDIALNRLISDIGFD
jgi:hypothetical protein